MMAATLFAALLALQAPISLDIDALKAGRLPASGTVMEADTCAAELMSNISTFPDSQTMMERNNQVVGWVTRAASLHKADMQSYSDNLTSDRLAPLASVDGQTRAALDADCADRLNKGTTRAQLGLPFAAETGEAKVHMELDEQALELGQLPAAGTGNEADVCAAVLTRIIVAGGRLPEVINVKDEWTKRAAGFRRMSTAAFTQDEGFIDAVVSLGKPRLRTEGIALMSACSHRLSGRT